MSNVASIVAKIKSKNDKIKPKGGKEEGSFSLIDYKPSDNTKSLAHIDKFLKVISMNNRINISYGDVPTAYIDMKTNTITLPNYITHDRDLYILMGSHEVSHALHTPAEFYTAHNTGKVPTVKGIRLNPNLAACINIVEDIRIEKLIRNKFPGFVGVYQRGYKKLIETNENFNITQDKWDVMGIHNRLNIKAKLGNLCQYELTDKEVAVFKYMRTAVSFDDVLIRAAYLYKLLVEEENDISPDDAEKSEDEQQDKASPDESDENEQNDGSDGNDSDKDDTGDGEGMDKSDKSESEPGEGESSDDSGEDGEDGDSLQSVSKDGQESNKFGESDKGKPGKNGKGSDKPSEMEALKDALKEMSDAIKESQNSADANEDDSGFSQDMLKELNKLANNIEANNDQDTNASAGNIMDAALEEYIEDIQDKYEDVSLFSSRKSQTYAKIIKDPLSSLVTLF